MSSFTDSVALVTGGAAGIGRDVALALGNAGASVVVADIDGDGAESTATRVAEETPGTATGVRTDVADEDSVAALVETTVETYGGLDVAVNNAGVTGQQAYLGDYEGAKRDLQTAIEKEDPGQDGYGERVGRYRHILSRIEMMEVKDEIDSKVAEAKASIEETRTRAETSVDELQARVIQFLGFFAALLAVVLVSTEIASSFPPTEAMRLLLLVFGGMLSSFAGLGLLLPIERTTRRSLAVLALGAALVAGAIGWQLA